MNSSSMIARDLQHIWHPCSIMKNFEQDPPLIVTKAQGTYLQTDQGQLIDGISSWWCKSLGHGHPAILDAIRQQLDCFEHVMPANTTHNNMVALGTELAALTRKQHVFFASDGACAVEIALKLAIQATRLKGQPQRNQILALRHAYHGETLGALSVSDMGVYKESWVGMGVDCHFLDPLPYVNHPQDPLWTDATSAWETVLPQLERLSSQICAIIVEPVIQGANGLRPYSADFLSKLSIFAKQHDIYLIADEIMTGLGRTGTWLASEHAGIDPDMICLSKGLTSGSVPMSCVLIDHAIYHLFYSIEDPQRNFMHSHTYGGNALAIAAALATIRTMKADNIPQQAQRLGIHMQSRFQTALAPFDQFSPTRSLGAIVAADYLGPDSPRFSRAFTRAAQQYGALLRPIGNTIYWLPPLNTTKQTIDALATITEKAIHSALESI